MLMRVCAAFVVAALASSHVEHAYAGAFLMQEQSAKASGRSYAGEAAIAQDASTIFYNPAGMTELSGAQTLAGGYMIKPEANLSNRGSTVTGVAVGGRAGDQGFDANPLTHLYTAAPIDSDLWFGLAVTMPFGLANKYKSDYFGRYDSIESSIATVDVAPSLAYAINPQVSIGGGLDVQYIKAKLAQAIPNPGMLGNPAGDGKFTVKGDDVSLGYNLGVLYKPTEDLRVGLSYRAAISHDVSGNAVQEFSGTTRKGVTANIDLPDIVGLGAAYRLTPQVTLLAQGNFYSWNGYDQVTFNYSDGTSSVLQEQFRSTFGGAIGAEIALANGWNLRTGLQYDQTPTRDAFRSTSMPDTDRIWFSVGASYAISRNVSFDFSYSHMFAKEEPINRSTTFTAIATTALTQGMTETSSDVLGFGLQVAF